MHEAMWLDIDYFLAVFHGFWDLTSPIRDQTLWVKIENLNHWTTRELPQIVKYFECHSGPLTSQKQPTQPVILSAGGAPPGYVPRPSSPLSGTCVSPGLSQLHLPLGPQCLVPLGWTHPAAPFTQTRRRRPGTSQSAHAVSGGPYTPSLMHSLGTGRSAGARGEPRAQPQVGRELRPAAAKGRAERRGSEVPSAASDTQTLAVLLTLRISCVKTNDSP